ncbi:MAG: ABC transporter permease [Spirochaetales bacterium]|nr:ABC transporter permease [Spirochaetales bacterium]
MSNETSLIMKRRFMGRILESGLLIIAVALGVGAAASGLSLMFHTKEYSQNLLNSAEYKEIVVTTRANVEDMTYPVVEKTPNTTTLTTADLKAGEIIDEVLYSYVVSSSHIRLVTEESTNMGFPREGGANPPQENANPENSNGSSSNEMQPGPPEGGDNMGQISEMLETFEDIKENPDYLVPEVEEIEGVEVTAQFFDAWGINAQDGSLFTSSDYTGSSNIIVLGSEMAKTLNTGNYNSVIGKKIVAWDKVYKVVGVLEETGSKYDNYYVTPKKEVSNSFFMRRFGDTQLRFYVDNVNQLDTTATQLSDWFTTQYGEGQVEISNPREEASKVVSRNNGISFLILFLSLAGLFIASVNVSNILMSRSLRMKKHVGILKALGASKKNILMIFVKEALLITSIGSVLGTFLALPLSITMEESLGLGDVSWVYIIIGVFMSSILTLIFSVLPARQSVDIEAAEAMRSAG